MAPAPGHGRDETLDALRGCAVALMVWVHLVPDAGPWTEVWALDALPAALFTWLVGVSAAAAGARPPGHVARRALALLAVGLPFWIWVWPNDVLVPIACMLPLVAALRSRPRATWAVAGVLVVAAAVSADVWGGYAWTEVRADGTHEANHSLGLHTLRYFLLHGAYPLLPWAAFPLLGLRFAAARSSRRALLAWAVGGAVAAVAGLLANRWGDAAAGGWRAQLDVTWQPTSLPFVLLWGGAVAVVGSLAYLARLRVAALAGVGRRSLHHYVAHLALVYWPLTIWWPDEDWSWAVGASAAAGYLVVAAALGGRRRSAGKR